MIYESGLDHLPGSEGEYKFSTFNAKAKTVRCRAIAMVYLNKCY